MSDHLFFNLEDLRSCGENVIIGKTARIRYPELVDIADNVIIDDFTYISTELCLSSYVHISSGCSIIGGRESFVEFGSFSTLAPNVVVAAGSDDYMAGLATPMVPEQYKGQVERGSVRFGDHCIVGANSTVLANVTFSIGASVGANSFVKNDLEAWYLYAGCPAKKLKARNSKSILANQAAFLKTLK